MSWVNRTLVIAALVCAVGVVLVVKHGKTKAVPSSTVAERTPLPRLIDLGADKCVPCKMMAPILEELKKEYAGIFVVEFIDVWKNPKASEQYEIRVIPTQIFYDNTGKEIFRHEGFFGKEDILAVWRKHGIAIQTTDAE